MAGLIPHTSEAFSTQMIQLRFLQNEIKSQLCPRVTFIMKPLCYNNCRFNGVDADDLVLRHHGINSHNCQLIIMFPGSLELLMG